MKYSFNVAGLGEALVGTFKVGASVIAGQVVIWDASNIYGTLADPSTTAAADAFGITLGEATYATTAEAEVEVVYSPDAVFECVAAGGTATGTALATTSPANVLADTGTSKTVISAAEVGTIDMSKGMIWGLNGQNKGQSRVLTSHSNSTSCTITVELDNAPVAGDKFVRVPWAPGVQNVQLTAEFDSANAIIATGTGIAANVVKVSLDSHDESYPTASVFFSLRDHFLNPLS